MPSLVQLIVAVTLAFATFSSAAPNDAPSAPFAKQLDQRLVAIDREITRRREAGQTDSAKTLADQLQYFRDRLAGKAKPQTNDPELHVITLYQGDTPNGQRQRFGNATVQVGPTDRPIILALGSYESVTWNLKIADGANVKKIILGGYYDQELAAPPANIPVEVHTGEAKDPNYFYGSSEPESRTRLLSTLFKITGLKISTLQYLYGPRGNPFTIGPDNPEWTAQRLLAEVEPAYLEAMAFERSRQREQYSTIRFKGLELIKQHQFINSAKLSDFTPLGPLAGTAQDIGNIQHIAIDPRGPIYYGLSMHEVFQLDLKNGKHIAMPVNNRNVPRLSWPCGLTFDTKRTRLVLVSLAGEGFMYSYSPQNKQWDLISSLNNIDLQSLTYSAEYDCYFGLGNAFGDNQSSALYRFKPDGSVSAKVKLSQPLPTVRPGPGKGFQLLSVGRQLILLTPPLPDPLKPDAEETPRSFLIDPDTGKITFSTAMSPQAPLAALALTPADLDALWQTATGKDKSAAEAAIWKLASAGDKAIPFLREKIPAPPNGDPDKLTSLITKLEHNDFKVREDAANDLAKLGPPIAPDLQAALKREIPPGTRSYIETILKRIETASTPDNLFDSPDPNIQSQARAISTLTKIATPKAIEALQEIASRPAGLPQTTLAKSSLQQLGRD